MPFSAHQTTTLRAVLNRLIPENDFLGAWEAGVGDYIVRLLQCDEVCHAPTYANGLDSVEAEARSLHQASFNELPPDTQDLLLARIEIGSCVTTWDVSPIEFFSLMVRHCAEGYYSDPHNGGNRDAAAWKMVGYCQMPGHTT